MDAQALLAQRRAAHKIKSRIAILLLSRKLLSTCNDYRTSS
jgi:hypothetical protein